MQTKTGIIFLQRDKFQFYSPYLTNLFEFRFVPEFIQDFDIFNRELLENLLRVFISNNKIPASGLVIVIADNASFIKDFVLAQQPIAPQQASIPPQTLADLQEQANEYLQLVPFESAATKTFPLANGVRAYATNQEVCEVLKSILEKLGFIFEGVFPAFVFDPGVSSRTSLDAPSISVILQKIPTLRQYNLMDSTISLPAASEREMPEEPGEVEVKGAEIAKTSGYGEDKNNKMIIAIASSAIVLILAITGGVMYYQFANPPYTPPPQPQASTPVQTQPVQPTAAISAAVEELTATIIYASGSASLAQVEQAQDALALFGFQSVDVQPQETLNAAESLLIFSPRVDEITKGSVTTNIQEIVSGVKIQEKADAVTDITIIFGQTGN